jgi:hypothetical protein
MRIRSLAASFVTLCAFALFLPSAEAGFTTFDLSWSGASFGNSAVATGTITMDPSVLATSGYNDNSGYALPANPFATSFSITISGASSGNGTFTLGDFDTVLINLNGTLDFTKELVGQATAGDPWGTPDGNGGDFNLLNQTKPGNPAAPNGTIYFTLTTDAGSGDPMLLTSFRPAPSAVPEPSGIILVSTGLGLTGIAILRRRRIG